MSAKPTQKPITKKEIENLLNQQLSQQTVVILNAVDSKINALEKRIDKLEIRIDQKLDRLATILDNFLKRLTDTEDEFVFMKADVKKIKAVLKEKLGVDLE